MNELAPHNRARMAQRLAADPELSAFVSANAGSGKTTVLVDRVLRLMLAGAEPGKVLCLTYTKAAAANMALRVFRQLADFAGMADDELNAGLIKLEGRLPDAARLVAARRLFARAVETPGGLKIETIHAFCERILQLFPFEANVPARFEVLDEAGSAALLAEARTAVLTEAAIGRRADLVPAFRRVSLEAAGEIFETAIAAALGERRFLRDGLNDFDGLPHAMAAVSRALGLAPDETVESIERRMIEDGLTPAEWSAVADALKTGKATDRDRARDLLAAYAAEGPEERLRCYLDVFFTKEREARKNGAFVTKAISPMLCKRLQAERDRLDTLSEKRKAAATVERTQALLMLADAILARVEALKSTRGALDFDDLIVKTRSLLTRSDTAWVLYKLDAGIDHVLVDEAQDTNPDQWDILKSLTEDFAAGAGARGSLSRTVFAVGDPKQSIFGFQGAEPREFEASGRHFRDRTQSAGGRFEAVAFNVSFRSAPAILAAVDAVFSRPENFAGLSFDLADAGRTGTVHESSRTGAHGRVELWPLVRPAELPEPEAWVLPVDEPEASAPPVVLAARIARAVKRWTSGEDGRAVPPGEILVLVRKRGVLFEAIIRALKQSGVPVAGADRLRLGEHIGVMDLIAAGRVILLPDDDLMLAALLKSPLIGLDDDDLIRIGARRPDPLSFAAALRGAAQAGDVAAAGAIAQLDRWRGLAERCGPFAFYATLLGPLGGRRALVSRLGPEAGDAIDEFLSLAFAHERRETPSLAAFLVGFVGAIHEIKRDMDAARGEVRVMTVHGAKGLEADLVILADACRMDPHVPVVAPVQAISREGACAVPVWLPRKIDRPRALLEALQPLAAAEREEHNRLLYVAMTRAKDRLVVAPYVGKSPAEPPAACWLAMIKAGLGAHAGRLVEEPSEALGEPILVWQSGTPGAPSRPAPSLAAASADPDWLRRPIRHEPEPEPPLRPSGALGAADGQDRTRDAPFSSDARLIGMLVHALIERLPDIPEKGRRAAAERFVAARAGRLAPAGKARVVADALAVLSAPELQPLFGPASRAEAPIVGQVRPSGESEPIAVSGQIDRLAVTDDAVLLADFKTTATPPADFDGVPEGYVTQLAVYRALLTQLFADRPVRAFLVWTAGPVVMEFPAERLDAALATLAAPSSSPRDAPGALA